MQSFNQPGPGALRYAKYCALLASGGSEDQIKATLGIGSLEVLYRILIQDGYPVCPVCGKTPAQPQHCEPPAKKRKARNSDSGVVKLPPAGDAVPLFDEIIGSSGDFFNLGLHRYLEALMHLKEELHAGRRFVSTEVYGPEYSLRREDFSEDEWREMCTLLDWDPEVKSEITPSDVPTEIVPLGAYRAPAKGLVVLIALYALTRDDLAPVIEKLHPDPVYINQKQLESAKEQLRLAAEHVAILVRGGTVGKGRPMERLSAKEATLAYWIAELKDKGHTYDEIYQEFKELGYGWSREGIERLGSFRLDC